MSKVLMNLKKLQDKPLQEVLRNMSYMIYVTLLQHKSKKKEELNSNRNKEFKRKMMKEFT